MAKARPNPRDEETALELRKRTPTNRYNARPQWLVDAHAALEAAVAVAYGWNAGMGEEETLGELLGLNRKEIQQVRLSRQ